MKTLLLLSLWMAAAAAAQVPDWHSVEQALGRKGTTQGDMIKIAFPRSDVVVSVGSVRVDPALALTSWAAFKSMGEGCMVMGDLVLLETEIYPVMTKLIAGGLLVSALHNHIIGETPVVMYMHFSGRGDAVRLAESIKEALVLTGTPLSSVPQAAPPGRDWSGVESIIGATGKEKGNVLQFSIPRAETLHDDGMELPPFMGMATAINLQGVGDSAATTGDFVLLADEVNPVVKSLTDAGIAVTAIHNHMLFESPRLFFVHFWGVNKAETLAKGLRSALDKTKARTLK